VKKLYVDYGEHAEAGQLLAAELDKIQLESRLRAAQARRNHSQPRAAKRD